MTAIDDLATSSSRLAHAVAEGLMRCLAPPLEASTMPAACYVDAGVYEVEQEAVFRTGWVGVGRVDRWPAVGDFAAIELGGVPIVVVRGDDRMLHAYANSCSHRSAQIMVGEGSCKRMRCPFHAWTYAFDGRLIGAPNMARTVGFEAADHSLTEFALAEHLGFVFVSFDADPTPLDRWLGDFDALHDVYDIGDLVTTRRREFTVDCNWKAFAEVFNEYYHLPYVHPNSIDDTYDEPDEPEAVIGAYATHFGSTQGTGGLLSEDIAKALPTMAGLGEREANGVRYTWLFPNIVIAVGADAMWGYEVYPDGPNRCRGAQIVAFPQSTIDRDDFADTVASYYERFDVALDEDIPILVQQHAGLSSPFARQGRYSHLEPSVARFAAWYAQRILDHE